MNKIKSVLATALATAVSCMMVSATAAGRINVLIVTGQNNHDWFRSTPRIKELLDQSGRFAVTISTSPSEQAPKDAWNAWNPEFAKNDVIISDYNGPMWPDAIKARFVEYVRNGGGVVIVHGANNAFNGWKEYEAMCGLLWRDNNFGTALHLDDSLNEITLPKGDGPGASHGKVHPYQITSRDKENPIFKDMPQVWMHADDELYHGQRGSSENLHLLATAFSSKESNGTGFHEPMVWWIPFGKGRVLSMMPGHLWSGQGHPNAYDCVGFRTLLQRAVEWTATGKVTIPIPQDFPSADKVSLIR